jgi:hypothetical protein
MLCIFVQLSSTYLFHFKLLHKEKETVHTQYLVCLLSGH